MHKKNLRDLLICERLKGMILSQDIDSESLRV